MEFSIGAETHKHLSFQAPISIYTFKFLTYLISNQFSSVIYVINASYCKVTRSFSIRTKIDFVVVQQKRIVIKRLVTLRTKTIKIGTIEELYLMSPEHFYRTSLVFLGQTDTRCTSAHQRHLRVTIDNTHFEGPVI